MDNNSRSAISDKASLAIIFLGIISLIIEYGTYRGTGVVLISHILDLMVSIIFVGEFLINFIRSRSKKTFLKYNLIEALFLFCFVIIFFLSKYYCFFVAQFEGHNVSTKFVMVLSVFNIIKVFMRIKRLNYIFKKFLNHPAQTIMMSFIVIILIGTILLMMPISTIDNTRIGFLNAVFTSTSATCVTGLTVLDTASVFSLFGKTVIMFLIQIGGLGIMVLAFFGAFILGKKLSFKEKRAMSYMLNENDSRNLSHGVKHIIYFTVFFEAIGVILLFLGFSSKLGWGTHNLFYSIFHSISAFCNAGFALFPDNLIQFRSNYLVNFVISGLIIAGGISFIVLMDGLAHIKGRFRAVILKKNIRQHKLSLNSSIVLTGTLILLIGGTFLIYKLEHRSSLIHYDIGTQYLTSFFQSVTLRTAGFNTLDITSLHKSTYFIMMLFMFIGGASGSIAGGVKINTIGVIWGYIRSIFTNRTDVVLNKHSIDKKQVNQAFLVVFMALATIFSSTLILSVTEDQKPISILFETFSAFGTVGLTTGLTPKLTSVGKFIIVTLMFIGRLGPLTVIMALSQRTQEHNIRYPSGQVNIG